MMIALLMLMSAEPQTATLSVSRQPAEALRAALLTVPRGISLYRALLCNQTQETLRMDEGLLLTAIARGDGKARLSTIDDPNIVALVVRRAKAKSVWARAAGILSTVIKIAGPAAALAAGAGFYGGGDTTKYLTVAFGALGLGLQLATERGVEGLEASQLDGFLRAGRTVELGPGACSDKLFLAAYHRGGPEVFQVQVAVP
jgi:hypothetical protein